MVNIIVGVLEFLKSIFPSLLASKRLQKCTDEVIRRVVLDVLLLMFMNGSAVTMCSVERSYKDCQSLLHVTCKVLALYFVAQTI